MTATFNPQFPQYGLAGQQLVFTDDTLQQFAAEPARGNAARQKPGQPRLDVMDARGM
jgi:hypothetical protein